MNFEKIQICASALAVSSRTITIAMAPPKSKTWCFTLANPEPSPDGPDLSEHWRTSPEAKHLTDLEYQMILIGFEVGEGGLEHLQGYIVFKYSKTLTAMKKINAKAHWEIAKYAECAANYCIKERNFNYEKIDRRTQGARTDVRAAVDTLRAHGLKRVKLDHPIEFLKYPSGFAALDVLNEDERNFKPDVLWLWGATGTGKSHFAKNVYPERKRWWSGRDLRWWQGYRGEDIAILDDFRPDFCKFHELLRILDCYPYKVEVKGSHRELNSKMIIITTIKSPRDLYQVAPPSTSWGGLGVSGPPPLFGDAVGGGWASRPPRAGLTEERLDQLMRRITKVVHATKSGDQWSLTPDPWINRPYLFATDLAQAQGGHDGAVLEELPGAAGNDGYPGLHDPTENILEDMTPVPENSPSDPQDEDDSEADLYPNPFEDVCEEV